MNSETVIIPQHHITMFLVGKCSILLWLTYFKFKYIKLQYIGFICQCNNFMTSVKQNLIHARSTCFWIVLLLCTFNVIGLNKLEKQTACFVLHEKLSCLSTLDKTSLVTILFRYIIHDVMYLQTMQYQFLHSVMVLACIVRKFDSSWRRETFEANVRSRVQVDFVFGVSVGGGWKQICLQSRRRRRHRSLSMLARSSSQCDNSKVNKSNDWLLTPEVKTASAPVTSTTSFPFILLSLTSFCVSCGFKMFSTAIDLATAHSRHVCCTLLDASQNLKSYFCK